MLGERDGDNVVAATVDAYTTPPDMRAGEIADISGSTIRLSDEWSDDRNNDGGDNSGQGNHGVRQRVRYHGSRELGDDPAPTPGPEQPTDGQPAGGSQPGADQPTTIDLTNVPVVLNGGSTITVSTLTAAEKIVVLGETDTTTGTFTPQIAFAFNQDDDRPATHHES